MNNLIIVHQSYQGSGDTFTKNIENLAGSSAIVWETCRRRLIFLENHNFHLFKTRPTDEVYTELDAEQFLIEVLCGLKSPLLGETEVFGQFKQWWAQLTHSNFKSKFGARIQHIYSVVKKIREESLCGLGSQSYGSLLRKKITDLELKANEKFTIDFLGSGQLVEEIVPWIQKKWSYRIWCRKTERVLKSEFGQAALEVKSIDETATLHSLLVVAAPLSHRDLEIWIEARRGGGPLYVYDFRHDSMFYDVAGRYSDYLHLDHFTTEVQDQKQAISQKIGDAKNKIVHWKNTELSRAQIRPFGWDDL